MTADAVRLRHLAERQFAVVTRAQALELGATPGWISRQVDRGRWQRVYPGTYAHYSGPLAWRTRAAAALAYAGPGAALSHSSAAYVHRLTQKPGPVVELSIEERRRVRAQEGLVIHRRRILPPTWGHPRAVDAVHTVIDLVDRAIRADEVVGLICSAARAGVAPVAMRRAALARSRLRHRSLALEMLTEVALGIESPLERRYRRDVEGAHGLPRSLLQARHRAGGRWIRADALYDGLGVRVELDGALAHPFGRTNSDTWRDNAVLIERGDITLRYRWAHVAATPCEVAAQVASALRSRGWTGRAAPCAPGCAAPQGARRQRG